jgi:diguanylate cyclase (GGDEF)-like protein
MAAPLNYCLAIVYPRDVNQCFKLGVEPRTIGSGKNADIVLNDERIAPIHCRIGVTGDDAVQVDDLGSSSGTWVEGEPVQSITLDIGQILSVGHYRFMLSRREASAREVKTPERQPPGKDRVTGAPNRSWILKRADAMLAARVESSRPVTLVMVAVDDLEALRSAHGYPAGDRLMRGVGGMLASALTEKESMGLFGTEKFLLLLPEVDNESAGERLQALCTQIRQQRFEYAGEALEARLSIGYATQRGEDIDSLDDFLTLAERALYRARRWGGDQAITLDQVDEASD